MCITELFASCTLYFVRDNKNKDVQSCKIAIATKWYQFHTTDKCDLLFTPWIAWQMHI